MPDEGLRGDSPMLERARLWLSSRRDLQGARLILSIMPGNKVCPNFNTEQPVARKCPGRPYQTGGRIIEEPIPMTDWKALGQYRQRSTQLIKEIEAALQLGFHGLAAEKRAVFDFLRRHIQEITTPAGKIKNFPSSLDKDYQRIFQLFRRVLNQAKTDDPEVYHYLKTHVKTGATFAWIPGD